MNLFYFSIYMSIIELYLYLVNVFIQFIVENEQIDITNLKMCYQVMFVNNVKPSLKM
jgi:hypothetical protein